MYDQCDKDFLVYFTGSSEKLCDGFLDSLGRVLDIFYKF